MTEGRNLKFSKDMLKDIISEELLNEIGQSAMTQLGGEDIIFDPAMGKPSYEDVLRSTIMDAIRTLKQGNVNDAVAQLQTALDASTGGAGLDK